MADDDDDTPMPGPNEFSADEEQQMRQARSVSNQAAKGDGEVGVPWSSFRRSTNIEDVRAKGPIQKAAEYVTRKPVPFLSGY